MENTCMAARAFKPSLRPEAFTNQMTLENFLPADSASIEDYLSADSFLDIPAGVDFSEDRGNAEADEEKDSSISSFDDCFSNVSSGSFLHSALPVPNDDLAELEWVSHFVDDSDCKLSLLVPSNVAKTSRRGTNADSAQEAASSNVSAVFQFRVPVKARTKRLRPTVLPKTWTTGYPFSHSTTISFHAFSFVDQQTDNCEPIFKRLKVVHSDRDNGSTQFQRRCSHCQVQKTPQWRTGPLGPKTLCNACGVRYKSGRLFPEYRPACSPSFSSEIHSNSHRKVLEMRKRKEIDTPVSRFNHMVPSF